MCPSIAVNDVSTEVCNGSRIRLTLIFTFAVPSGGRPAPVYARIQVACSRRWNALDGKALPHLARDVLLYLAYEADLFPAARLVRGGVFCPGARAYHDLSREEPWKLDPEAIRAGVRRGSYLGEPAFHLSHVH